MTDFKNSRSKEHDLDLGKHSGGQDLEKELKVTARKLVNQERRKFSPPRIVESRCSVCSHDYRDFIEALVASGSSYSSIERTVTPKVDRRAVSHHVKNHMTVQDTALRAVLEEEADKIGRMEEEGVKDILTRRGVLEVAMRKGFEDLKDDVTAVEPKDLISIVKLLGEMDSHQGNIDVDEINAKFQIFLRAIKDICSIDEQAQISKRIKELRKAEGYTSELEAGITPAVEAEVIDEPL